eukprot:48032-Amphidinium_carterae.1
MAVELLARPQVRPTSGTHTGATGVQRMLARPHPPRKAKASAPGPGKAGPGVAPRLEPQMLPKLTRSSRQ